MLKDLVFAWRRLRSSAAASAFTISTLAVGSGVTVGTYSVVYHALWRPLGITDAARVVLIGRSTSIRPGSIEMPWTDYELLLDHAGGAIARPEAWSRFAAVIAGGGTAELAPVEFVTGGYFEMLGVHAYRGRVLTPDDDRAGAPAAVLLSYAAWRDQFGSDPDIVGKSIRISQQAVRVVGITPRGFRGVHPDGLIQRAAWLPMHLGHLAPAPRAAAVTVGWRLRPGDTRNGATAAIRAIADRLDVISPRPFVVPGAPPQTSPRYWTTASIDDDQAINVRDGMGRLIVGLPALVLLIACTNIANLVLSRGAARRHDFAVRRALGASRWRLVREQLIEQTPVVLAGGLAGVPAAYLLVRAAMAVTRETLSPIIGDAPLDWTLDASVVYSTAAVLLLAIVVCALVPALHLTRDSLRSVLDQGGPASTPRWRARANLVALQVGVSVGLFLVAVVFVRIMLKEGTLRRPGEPTAGLDRMRVTSIPFSLQERSGREVISTTDRVLADLRGRPGVLAAGAGSSLPFGRGNGTFLTAVVAVRAPNGSSAAPSRRETALARAVSPGLFRALGQPLSFGREFNEDDAAGAPPVAIINEGLAVDLFATPDAIGRSIVVRVDELGATKAAAPEPMTIVGVIPGGESDAGAGGRKRHGWEVMVPFAQHPPPVAEVVVQSSTPRPVAPDVLRDAVRRSDPGLAVAYAATASVLVNGPLAFLGYITATLFGLALVALSLAMAGLYGVLSHVVASRTREMGIRVALGATRARILHLVLRDGFRPIMEGLFIGLLTATVVRIFLKTALLAVEIAPVDPLACAAAVLLGAVAGAAACTVPARRAASVDPIVALRHL